MTRCETSQRVAHFADRRTSNNLIYACNINLHFPSTHSPTKLFLLRESVYKIYTVMQQIVYSSLTPNMSHYSLITTSTVGTGKKSLNFRSSFSLCDVLDAALGPANLCNCRVQASDNVTLTYKQCEYLMQRNSEIKYLCLPFVQPHHIF